MDVAVGAIFVQVRCDIRNWWDSLLVVVVVFQERLHTTDDKTADVARALIAPAY